MTEQTLLRLAMILQDQAPSTLNKYVCKLTEAILLDYPDGVNLYDISKYLNQHFNLTFTEEEIQQAISKKGHNRIVAENGLYKLSASVRSKLALQPSIADKLSQTICNFLEVSNSTKTVEEITSLLLKHFYYCFNSNVDNLLSLFNHHSPISSDTFEMSAEDVTIINEFIAWDNPAKNTLIYNLIATCYEYCMLTIKKDNILSSDLFKGKRFYLDANILFRMAGINNEERKTVTQSFIYHCRQVGIELYCTSATLDEVYRVITAQVGYIKGISGMSMPVSCDKLATLNPNTEVNDFYRMYYDWCKMPGNKYGDFTSFHQYLLSLTQQTISQLKVKESSAYKMSKDAIQYDQRVANLKAHKNAIRTWKPTSTASAETDITNIMDTLLWRSGSGTNIWQTNDFIVSADQLLIGWSEHAYPGVPIVVLPSVWLSIILRFTGRTDDDYKSFCLFLTQRQHINVTETIDPIQLLRTINTKTSQADIRERIIVEIAQNKSQYSFKNPEDYLTNTERAFDKVLEEVYGRTAQEIEKVRQEMRQEIEELRQNPTDQTTEETAIRVAAERAKTITLLAKNKAAKKVKPFRSLNERGWILYLLAGLLVLFGLCVCIWEIAPFYSWLIDALPEKLKASYELIFGIWAIFTGCVCVLTVGFKGLFKFLASEQREQRLYNKYYHENEKALT